MKLLSAAFLPICTLAIACFLPVEVRASTAMYRIVSVHGDDDESFRSQYTFRRDSEDIGAGERKILWNEISKGQFISAIEGSFASEEHRASQPLSIVGPSGRIVRSVIEYDPAGGNDGDHPIFDFEIKTDGDVGLADVIVEGNGRILFDGDDKKVIAGYMRTRLTTFYERWIGKRGGDDGSAILDVAWSRFY